MWWWQRCAGCGASFRPRPQVPKQHYCSKPECQQERRRRWKQGKRRTDPDYRDNQTRAQRTWSKRHPGYWSEYRRSHPEYRERNRQQQRVRNARRGAPMASDQEVPAQERQPIAKRNASIAKRNAPESFGPEFSGTYVLTPLEDGRIAKRNAWTVKISAKSKD
jgi:hypothetical protein